MLVGCLLLHSAAQPPAERHPACVRCTCLTAIQQGKVTLEGGFHASCGAPTRHLGVGPAGFAFRPPCCMVNWFTLGALGREGGALASAAGGRRQSMQPYPRPPGSLLKRPRTWHAARQGSLCDHSPRV